MAGEAVAGEAAAERSESSIVERLWARDESLWGGPGVPEIGDRLGWLDVAQRMQTQLPAIEAWAEGVHADGLTNTVLLGMGGSSLGPEVLNRSFGRELTMLDSTDPAAVLAAVSEEDLARTIFVVSSKSGRTIETLSHFKHFHELCGGNGAQFCAVTDPGSPLQALAEDNGFRKVWTADPEIGGRYSVLSHFGLVPAALAGVPLTELLSRAVRTTEFCRQSEDNPGFSLGEKFGSLALAGRDKLTFIVDPPIDSLGLWLEQLTAESTGKHGKGILPVAGEPPAPPKLVGEYGEDRTFVHIANGAKRDLLNSVAVDAIEQADHPVFRMAANGPEDLGPLMFIFEFAIAVAGHVLGINPFDQPNVQEAKDATTRVLESGQTQLPFDDVSALKALVDGAGPPDWFAILGYLQPGDDFDAAVEDLRRKIRARTRSATTFGYGPRYLHSTGQLHKGGPPTGRFIQLVHDGPQDVPIPGESYGFRTLKHAQAVGDVEALKAHGRPVVRLELKGDDPAAALRAITASLD